MRTNRVHKVLKVLKVPKVSDATAMKFEIAGFGLWAIIVIVLIGWATFRAIPDLPSPGTGAEAVLPRPNPATLPAKTEAEPADQLFQEFLKKLQKP